MPKTKKPSNRATGSKRETEAANKNKTTFKFCPFTGDKIWITTVTLSDIKRVQKSGNCPSSKGKKELVRIPSKSIRDQLLQEAADAIAARELLCFPPYGGRPWRVSCKLTEPKNAKPPLFRWFRGQLEVACLPHLLERIPEPPRLRGKSMLEEHEADDEYVPTTALQERAVSTLSDIAWNDDEYGIPTVTLKYMSPNDTRWLTSRKSAHELRDTFMENTLLLDKVLHGYGARGQEIKPFKPSKQQALSVGKMRFERDGLWVVGQEEAWQEERAEKMLREQKEKEESIKRNSSKCTQIEDARNFLVTTGSSSSSSSNEDGEKKKRPMTGLKLFLLSKRETYRAQKMAERAAAEVAAAAEAAPAPQTTEKKPEDSVDGPSNSDAATETTTTNPQGDIDEGSPKNTRSPMPGRMTLRDAERELRDVWKTLPREEQQEWKKRAQEHERQQHAEQLNAAVSSMESSKVADPKPAATSEAAPADLKDTGQHVARSAAISAPGEASGPAPANVVAGGAGQDSAEDDTKLPAVDSDKLPAEDDAKLPVVDSDKTAAGSKVLDVVNVPAAPAAAAAATEEEDNRPLVSPSPLTAGNSSEDDSAKHNKQSVLAVIPSLLPKKRRAPSSRPPRQIELSSHWRLKPEYIDLCYEAAMDHYDNVMNTVTARALHNELQDGFDLLRERGRGRFDMELPVFDTPQFSFLTDINKAAWMPVVRQILGEDVVLIHKGCFLSMPGAASQEYHQDGPHLNKQHQRPCHAINVFIPLVDLHIRNGPTEFCLGTHYLGQEGYVKERIETPTAPAGTPVIFDYRLGHRGLANTSNHCRPIVYCTYAAAANGKEFRDSVNFSRKRYHRIGDLVEKPLSRDERTKRRRQCIEEQLANEEESEEDASESGGDVGGSTAEQTGPQTSSGDAAAAAELVVTSSMDRSATTSTSGMPVYRSTVEPPRASAALGGTAVPAVTTASVPSFSTEQPAPGTFASGAPFYGSVVGHHPGPPVAYGSTAATWSQTLATSSISMEHLPGTFPPPTRMPVYRSTGGQQTRPPAPVVMNEQMAAPSANGMPIYYFGGVTKKTDSSS